MTDTSYVIASQLEPADAPANPIFDQTAALLRESIFHGCVTSPRSLQPSLGASEIGSGCERQMVYKQLGVEPVNFTDPLRALVGTGVHLALAELFRRLGGRSGRYLIEHRVSYRGIPGTLDLYDRWNKTLIDWKSPLLKRIKDMPRAGVSQRYIVQAHIYGCGLREQGETPERVGLAFLPPDGSLADMWCPTWRFDPEIADRAIDRFEAMNVARQRPSDAPATPTRLCPWCDHYRPGSTDLDVACPGEEQDHQ